MRSTWILALCLLSACKLKNCGRSAQKVVPVFDRIDRDYATEDVPCDEPYPTPAPRGCAMDTLTCGDRVEGYTGGGESRFDYAFYRSIFCTPENHRYGESPEAVYALELPADIQADVYMTTDCEDLDVLAISWPDAKKSCPKLGHLIHECEMDTSVGSGHIRMTTVTRPQTYVLAVDGKRGAVGNFRLEVECSTYR